MRNSTYFLLQILRGLANYDLLVLGINYLNCLRLEGTALQDVSFCTRALRTLILLLYMFIYFQVLMPEIR
jgi:hypothetical protein